MTKLTKKKKNRGMLITIVIIFAFIAIFYFASIKNDAKELSQPEFKNLITTTTETEGIDSVSAQDNIIIATIKGTTVTDAEFSSRSKYDYYVTYSSDEELALIVTAIDNQNASGTVLINYTSKVKGASIFDYLLPVAYFLLIIGVGYILIKSVTKSNSNAIGFGKSTANAVKGSKVRFKDVAGADEEKKELQEIVEFLKNPKKFTEVGAKIPKGVLLVGNPGTGKTMLAKAVAGEGKVPFFSISGSDFVEMFVGVGASRVRDLFAKAKRNKPCIIFIDEIDAVGRKRGAGLGTQNDEREQTLNQLLTELDGFENNDGVIVMAATNRADVLDPALLRPGRFDRQVYIHMPDVKGREAILNVHTKGKPLDEDVNFATIARLTSGFSGADLANLLNEAAILTARENRRLIRQVDIAESVTKVLMGPQKKSHVTTERDNRITAYHESGHAIIGKLLPNLKDEVEEVSIVSRGMAAGYTLSRPDTDDSHVTYNYLNSEIAMMMGGRIAEELVIKDITTGASNDIQRATELARKMVTEWGMSSDLGFISFGSHDTVFIGRDYQSQNNYSEKYAATIDTEVQKILDRNYIVAKELLTKHLNTLDSMANILIEKKTIYRDEVDMIINGKTQEEVYEFIDAKTAARKIKDDEAVKKSLELLKAKEENEKKLKDDSQKQRDNLVKSGLISPEQLDELLKNKKNK